VFRFSETIEIDAEVGRVWRALIAPEEVVSWDTVVSQALDSPTDYPRPGQHVRWRYRLGPLRLVLHDRPSRIEPCSVLRSQIKLGPFNFDETYTLCTHGLRTQLTAQLSVSCPIAIVGPLLTLLIGRPLAHSTVRDSLAAIKRHCEQSAC